MSEKIKDFFAFLKQKLGPEMPEDVSQEAHIKSQDGPWDFIQAAREIPPKKDWLFGEVQTLLWDVASKGSEAVFLFREPGFSNEQGSAQEVKTLLAKQECLAATVIDAQAQHDRSRVCEKAVLAVVTCCEEQLIKGGGNNAGLLNMNGATPIDNEKNESREKFCCHAIEEYENAVGHKPTLIVLSSVDGLMLHAEKGMEHSAQEPPKEVGGVPLMVLESVVPEGRGLLLTVNDIVFTSSPLEWEFGYRDDRLRANGHSEIIVRYEMGLIIRRPEAVAQLAL